MATLSLDLATAQKTYDQLKKIASYDANDGNYVSDAKHFNWENLTESDLQIAKQKLFGKKPVLKLDNLVLGDRSELIGLFGTLKTWDSESGFDGKLIYKSGETTRYVSVSLSEPHPPYTLEELRKSVFTVTVKTPVSGWEGTAWVIAKQDNGDGTFTYDLCTNAHVADGELDQELSISVEIPDGNETKSVAVTVMPGVSHDYDVAFLQLTTSEDLKPLPVVDLQMPLLQEGDGVWIAGNLSGDGTSLNFGLITNPDFYSPYWDMKFYQTDAGVTHGNSGSPVLNASGEVVALHNSGDDETGQKWSIPIHYVMKIYSMIKDGQPVTLGQKNLYYTFYDEDTLKSYPGLEEYNRAYLINQIKAGNQNSPDEIQAGDFLIEFNGDPVPDLNRQAMIYEVMRAATPGSTISAKVFRNGKIMDCHIPIVPDLQERVDFLELRSLNLAFSNASEEFFYDSSLAKQPGVPMYRINIYSDGTDETKELIGLLKSINGVAVATLEDVSRVLDAIQTKNLIFTVVNVDADGEYVTSVTQRNPNYVPPTDGKE